jgi:ribose 5-phosphate isomerase B
VKVAVGSDHGGILLKETVVTTLRDLGASCRDFGTFDTTAVDYPDIAREIALLVAGGEYDRGVLVCGTGVGVCIVANKVNGIRAALCHDPVTARLSREHNDANVLCLGARIIGVALAEDILRVWIATPFSGEPRHSRRINKIAAMDGEQ